MKTRLTVDKKPSVVLAEIDVDAVRRARRWIMGAAKLLDDASNGDPVIERLAREAASLAVVAEIVESEYSSAGSAGNMDANAIANSVSIGK